MMSAFQPFSVIYLDISMYAKKKTPQVVAL